MIKLVLDRSQSRNCAGSAECWGPSRCQGWLCPETSGGISGPAAGPRPPLHTPPTRAFRGSCCLLPWVHPVPPLSPPEVVLWLGIFMVSFSQLCRDPRCPHHPVLPAQPEWQGLGHRLLWCGPGGLSPSGVVIQGSREESGWRAWGLRASSSDSQSPWAHCMMDRPQQVAQLLPQEAKQATGAGGGE